MFLLTMFLSDKMRCLHKLSKVDFAELVTTIGIFKGL
jgi:hypothetical protein